MEQIPTQDNYVHVVKYISNILNDIEFNAKKDLNNTTENVTFSNLLKIFNSYLYNSEISYDVSGCSIILVVPPDLSGYYTNKKLLEKFGNIEQDMKDAFRHALFLATEFISPEMQLETSEFSSGAAIKIPFVTSGKSGGQMSINYFDTSSLIIYRAHQLWVKYIEDVIAGDVCPALKYITPGDSEYGALDYATSVYVIRYKSVTANSIYVAKATGVIPLNLPAKEVIGSRQQNQVTILPFNYVCADFTDVVINDRHIVPTKLPVVGTEERNQWVLNDLRETLKTLQIN